MSPYYLHKNNIKDAKLYHRVPFTAIFSGIQGPDQELREDDGHLKTETWVFCSK